MPEKFIATAEQHAETLHSMIRMNLYLQGFNNFNKFMLVGS
jgi:hypothetical protein